MALQGITMKFQNEQLPSVLKRIEKTTDYKFVFAYDDVKNCSVTGELHDASISEAMTVILAGQPLGYTVNGRTVNIRRTRQATGMIRVTGTVVDANTGETLIGATIRVGETKRAVVTDVDGRFTIDDVRAGEKLAVSCLGMYPTIVSAATNMKITLKPFVQNIDDVVVTGIFQRKKEGFTGSAAKMTGDELRKFSSGIPWGAYKDERTIKFIAFFVKQPYAEWRGMHIIDAIKWYEQENGLLMEKS